MFHIILAGQSIGAYPSRAIATLHLVPNAYIVAPCVWEVVQAQRRQAEIAPF